MNSKRKGTNGERLLAKELQKYGYDTHRTAQFRGGADSPDVTGLPGIHIECKFYHDPLSHTQKETFVQQAERDSEGKAIPAVFHKANRQPWEVTMRVCDFCILTDGRSMERGLITMRLDEWMEVYKR